MSYKHEALPIGVVQVPSVIGKCYSLIGEVNCYFREGSRCNSLDRIAPCYNRPSDEILDVCFIMEDEQCRY